MIKKFIIIKIEMMNKKEKTIRNEKTDSRYGLSD